MATSRTGTTRYLRNSAKVKKQARAAGLTHCPGVNNRECGNELDYETAQQPNSAETDHILEHRHGGTDDPSNLRVLCRTCNLARNATKTPVTIAPADDFPTSRAW